MSFATNLYNKKNRGFDKIYLTPQGGSRILIETNQLEQGIRNWIV